MYFYRYVLFDVHLNDLEKNVTGILVNINQIGNCFDKSTRILVIQSVALSSTYYCIQVWGSTNATLLQRFPKCVAPLSAWCAAKIWVGFIFVYNCT